MEAAMAAAGGDPDKMLVVDCLLPGQVRRLGTQATFVTARRPVQTTISLCEIRGGEYIAYDRANLETALRFWLPSAEAGDVTAQNNVGEIYERGLGGTAPDYARAAEWFRRAADQGSSRAQANLARLYEQGLGVPQDRVTALNLYRQAADLTDDELAFVSSIEELQQRAVRAEARADTAEREVRQLRGQLGQLRGQLSQKDREQASIRQRLEQARQQLSQATDQVGTPQASLSPDSATEVVNLRLQLAESARETSRLEQEAELLQARVTAQERGMAALRAQLQDTEQQLQQLQQQREQLVNNDQQLRARQSEELIQAQRELAAARSALEQQEQRMTALDDGRAEVQQLRQQLGQRSQQIAQLEQALNQATQQLERETTLNRELEQARTELAQTRARLIEQRERAGEQAGEQAEASAELERMEQELAARNRRIAELEQSLANSRVQLAEQASLEVQQLNLALARQQLEEARQQLTQERTTLGQRETAELDQLIQQLENQARDLRQHERQIEQLEQQLSTSEQRLAEATGKLEALQSETQHIQTAIRVRGTEPVAGLGQQTQDVRQRLLNMNLGRYYALVIGNNQHQAMPDLETAVRDARAVSEVLRNRYSFQVELLTNATRAEILTALNRYQNRLGENDNFLLYYAGHGDLDRVNDRGYWLPVDATPNDTTNWIANSQVTDILNIMPAKHVMVIADSCYSGSLTGGTVMASAPVARQTSPEQYVRFLEVAGQRRARVVLTSGGLQPVLDAGGGEHSVFASQLLQVLRGNDQILESPDLFVALSEPVKLAARRLGVNQQPEYARIHFAGDVGVPFFLQPRV
jgi:predicted  nucleic acid-binding Zn-ribbon protein